MSGGSGRCRPNEKSIIIPAAVAELNLDDLCDVRTVEAIAFAPGSQLQRLSEQVFSSCTSLKSVCFPACLERLPSCLFCPHLIGSTESAAVETVTFEAGSRLRKIDHYAFCGCHSLKSVYLPASVEYIHGLSFAQRGL
jgi:hypothetical protein